MGRLVQLLLDIDSRRHLCTCERGDVLGKTGAYEADNALNLNDASLEFAGLTVRHRRLDALSNGQEMTNLLSWPRFCHNVSRYAVANKIQKVSNVPVQIV